MVWQKRENSNTYNNNWFLALRFTQVLLVWFSFRDVLSQRVEFGTPIKYLFAERFFESENRNVSACWFLVLFQLFSNALFQFFGV